MDVAREYSQGRGIFEELAKALSAAQIGIVCLTPENLDSTWIHFESGALFKAINGQLGRVCTYLIGGLQPSQLSAPLNHFQATVPTKADTLRWVKSIKAALDEHLGDVVIERSFDAQWGTLEKELRDIPSNPDDPFPPDQVQQNLAFIKEVRRRDEKGIFREIISSIESTPDVLELKCPAEFGDRLVQAPESWQDEMAWKLAKEKANS